MTAIRIPAGPVALDGELSIPPSASSIVLFAHGSGSSRHSPRNQYVAHSLQEAGLGTLLFDLLTYDEEHADRSTGHLRFDIQLLADRLVAAALFLLEDEETRQMRFGFFGSSTGGGAALVAAAELGGRVGAVVSRGGRPDLAGAALGKVKCPTLLIVGGEDRGVIQLNQQAMAELGCEKELRLIPGATHLFEESGALEMVAHYAADWFTKHLISLSGRSDPQLSPAR